MGCPLGYPLGSTFCIRTWQQTNRVMIDIRHRRENGRMWYFCPAPSEYDRSIAIRRLRREDAPDDVVSFLKMSNENHISMSEVVDRCLECNLPTTLAHSICDSLPSTTANHVEKVLAHSLLPRHKRTKPATYAHRVADSKKPTSIAAHMLLRSIEIATAASNRRTKDLRTALAWEERFEKIYTAS